MNTTAKTIDEALSVALRRLKRSVPQAEVYAAHVSVEEGKWRVELSVARFSIPHVYDVGRAEK